MCWGSISEKYLRELVCYSRLFTNHGETYCLLLFLSKVDQGQGSPLSTDSMPPGREDGKNNVSLEIIPAHFLCFH